MFGNREAEHAELGHFADHFERDVAVGAVPALGVRDHFAVGEFAHFLAHRIEDVVQPAIPDRGAGMAAHQCDQPGAIFRGVAGFDQFLDRCREPRRHRAGGKSEVGGPYQFALTHQDAAGHLG